MRILVTGERIAGTLAAAFLVGALAVVSGCGSSDGNSGNGSGGGTTSSSYFSPLDEFMNPSADAKPTSDAEFAAKEQQVQELVASCMADEGFQYLPFVWPISTATKIGGDEQLQGRAWVEKYGYGLSTFVDPGTSSPTSEVVDPNQAIVEAMSDAERSAYYTALYGGPNGGYVFSSSAGGGAIVATASAVGGPVPLPAEIPAAESTGAASTDAAATGTASTDAAATDAVATGAADPSATAADPSTSSSADSTSMPSLADQGCQGKARVQVYGEEPTNDGGKGSDQFQSLFDAMSNLYQSVDKDSRVAAAVTSWVDCMSGVGYPGFVAIWDASQQASDKWGELNGWGMAASSDGGGSVSTSADVTPTSPPAADVAAFTQYELKIALADFDCKDAAHYQTVYDEVRVGLETQFVEDHRAELEQYRDSMNGGR